MTIKLETLARLVHCLTSGGAVDSRCPRALEELRTWERQNPCCEDDLVPVTKAEKSEAAKAERDAAAKAEREAAVAALAAERDAIVASAKNEAEKILATVRAEAARILAEASKPAA